MPNVGFVRKEVVDSLAKWCKVEDCLGNDIAIKAKRETYLPIPETNTDKNQNRLAYEKYLSRAVFYPVTSRTKDGLIGQVFQKDVSIELPTSLENLISNVDGVGTSIEQQAKQTLKNVLAFGRCGLLSDFPVVEQGRAVTRADIENGNIRPRVIVYEAKNIINWRETSNGGKTELTMIVLKEQKIVEDDGFEFECEDRWRVYKKEDNKVLVQLWKAKDKTNISEKTEYEQDGEDIILTGQNNKPLTKIPFEFVGSMNNDSSVDDSPLYPLACLNIAHYRNSADYEQMLFITGQATPVFSGLTEDWNEKYIAGKVLLGSSNAIGLPAGASATLLQAQSNSLPMEGMTHKEDQMKAIGAKLIEPNQTQRTATETEIEESSDASVLSSCSKNVSSAYRKAVHNCSLFAGEVEPDEIIIELLSEFQVTGLNAQERQEVIGAMQAEVITWTEARDVYRRKGIAYLVDDDARVEIENSQIALGNTTEVLEQETE